MYVTCLVPSDRVIVLRSPALTPCDATGVPFVVTGGHTFAQAPEQFLGRREVKDFAAIDDQPERHLGMCQRTQRHDVLDMSRLGWYRPQAAAAAVALELDVELLLPQPATINATPTSAAAPTERIFAVVQFAIVCCSQLVVFSGPVGGGRVMD